MNTASLAGIGVGKKTLLFIRGKKIIIKKKNFRKQDNLVFMIFFS